MKITKEFLEQHGACQKGISFFEINFPDGLDLDKVEIKGDFENYWCWLKLKSQFECEYNEQGNVIVRSFSNGEIFKFDDSGRCVECSDPINGKINYEYDSHGRLLKKIRNVDGMCCYTIEHFYDLCGNLIEQKLSPLRSTYYQYDSKNKKVYSKQLGFEPILYEYNKKGNMVKETFEGDVFKYKYDKKNNLIGIFYSDGTKDEYKYKYDNQNRLVEISHNGYVQVEIKYK